MTRGDAVYGQFVRFLRATGGKGSYRSQNHAARTREWRKAGEWVEGGARAGQGGETRVEERVAHVGRTRLVQTCAILRGVFSGLKCAGDLSLALGRDRAMARRRPFSVVLSSWARVRPIRLGFQEGGSPRRKVHQGQMDARPVDRGGRHGSGVCRYSPQQEARSNQDASSRAEPRCGGPRSVPQGRVCVELRRAHWRRTCGRRRRHRGRLRLHRDGVARR